MLHIFPNPHRDPSTDCYPPMTEPLRAHRLLPTYAPTRLVHAPELARRLGIGRVSIKDESLRFGLPSFKMLGAAYAVYRALAARLGAHAGWTSLAAWRAALAPLRPCALATATDGNHGRAVAHLAHLLDLEARIFVPRGTTQARMDAIANEGAEVLVVAGSYDDAVARAAREASDRCLVIADTALAGDEAAPQWVIDGYSTLFHEIDVALEQERLPPPDVVAVQMGVGALAAACVRHFRQQTRALHPLIVGVEPTEAACVLRSLVAGQMITLPGAQHSVMAGLNCGTPSAVAWPVLAAGLDLCVAIDDAWAGEGICALAREGVVSGESGAAGLAGMLALGSQAEMFLPLTPTTHLLVISTEGATDPHTYTQAISADRTAAGRTT